MSGQNCGNCYYWRSSLETAPAYTRECRRHAPRINPQMSYVMGAWPSTDAPMWCGEWLDKQPGRVCHSVEWIVGDTHVLKRNDGKPWDDTPGGINPVDKLP